MDKRQLFIAGGIIILGLLLAFPLTAIFTEPRGQPVNYRLAIRQTDDRGAEWGLSQVGGPPIREEDANSVPPKAPILVRTDIHRSGEHNVLIGLILADAGGRRYYPLVIKGGFRQPTPKLRIVDEAGKVLLNGNFQYG